MRIVKNELQNNKQYLMLIENIHRTENELQETYSNLAYMVEPDLIDYYIYQLKAVQMRHKFLLAKVKQIEDSYTKNPLDVSY